MRTETRHCWPRRSPPAPCWPRPRWRSRRSRSATSIDYTGATSSIGKISGPGKVDAIAWINANGGINGKLLDVEIVDYGYQTQRSHPALQEVEGRRRGRHPGLRHQRHRGDGRLHRRGQDPVLLVLVLRPPDRSDRHQRQGEGGQDQVGAVQLLRRSRPTRTAPARWSCGRPRTGRRRAARASRSTSTSATTIPIRWRPRRPARSIAKATGLRRRAVDPVRARRRRLQGAVPGAASVRRQLRVPGQYDRRQRRACCARAPRSASTCSSWPTSGAWTRPA